MPSTNPESNAQVYPVPEVAPPPLPPQDNVADDNSSDDHFYSPDTSSPPVLPPIASLSDSTSYFNDGPPTQPEKPSGANGKLRKPVPAAPAEPVIQPVRSLIPSSTEPELNAAHTKRLSKAHRRRSSSIGHAAPPFVSQTNLTIQGTMPSDARIRSSSAQPPNQRQSIGSETRIISGPPAITTSRPPSSHDSSVPTSKDTEKRGRLRRSWLPGSRSRSNSKDVKKGKGTKAWVLGQDVDYNTDFLASGERVPELWSEQGDVYVWLHPRGSASGPSFKVPYFAISTSVVFQNLIAADSRGPALPVRSRTQSFSGRDSLSAADAEMTMLSPPAPVSEEAPEQDLFLLMSPSHAGGPGELERLVSIRNLFAFLTGQPLVATSAKPTLFKVLLELSDLLKEFEFTSANGESFGDAVDMSFGFLMDQHALADVRQSREKTLEALVLGERMRSMNLYKEAFAHAAGKYTALREIKSPLWDLLIPSTRERLERAHFDLVNRQNNVNNRLEAFEFPALFSGIANSTTHTEYRDVKYAIWRKSFNRMRQLVLGHYKAKFGNWPPKARSKKNTFSESGLNRQVLKILYSDCCALYDLMADRENITTRVIDQSAEDDDNIGNPHISALRKLLTEFDHSSPPVLPPIPFDVPLLPDMSTIQANYATLPPKEQQRLDKNLQEYQRVLILTKSYDFETYKLSIPLLEEFKELEDKETHGKTVAEMAEQRIGYWLFLYVVIQSLPMLVIDAPGLQFTEGVEYFLCQPPRGNPPWIEDAPMVRKRWYNVDGGGMVELSSDAVEFGIEGIYHRSHCWLAAKEWELRGPHAIAPPAEEPLSPLAAPDAVFTDNDPATGSRSESPSNPPPGIALRGRSGSPHDRQQAYRKSVALGLEPVMLPPDGDMSQNGPMMRPPSSGQWSPAAGLAMRNRSTGHLPSAHSGTPPISDHAGSGSRQGSMAAAAGGARQGSVGGSTFDDILKDIEQPKKKKKSFF